MQRARLLHQRVELLQVKVQIDFYYVLVVKGVAELLASSLWKAVALQIEQTGLEEADLNKTPLNNYTGQQSMEWTI